MFAARGGFNKLSGPGRVGVGFNGSSYYQGTISANTLSTTNNYLTISLWFKPLESSPINTIISGYNSTGSEDFFRVNVANNEYSLYIYKPTGASAGSTVWEIESSTGGTAYTQNNWSHFVFSGDASVTASRRIAINGTNVSVTLGSNLRSQYNLMAFLNSTFNIGSSYNGYAPANCQLAQVYISDHYYDLSVANNRQLFYNNGWVDMGDNGTASGLPAPVFFYNGSKVTDPTFRHNSGRTTGTYVTIADLTATNDAGITSVVGP